MKYYAPRHILVVIICGMMLATFSLPAQAMTLKIDNVLAPLKGEVEIAVVAEQPRKLGPIQFRVVYDAKIIEILDVKSGSVYDGSVMQKNDTPGELDIFMTSNAEEGVNEDGPIAIITAKVIGDENDKTALALKFVEAFERDSSTPIYIDVATIDGELTVVPAALPWLLIAAIAGAILVLLLLVALTRRRRAAPTVQAASPSATSACPSCGHANLPGTKFCKGCGTSLQKPACPNCGKENEPQAKFCGDCGTSMADS